jgi:hypothetical protein
MEMLYWLKYYKRVGLFCKIKDYSPQVNEIRDITGLPDGLFGW